MPPIIPPPPKKKKKSGKEDEGTIHQPCYESALCCPCSNSLGSVLGRQTGADPPFFPPSPPSSSPLPPVCVSLSLLLSKWVLPSLPLLFVWWWQTGGSISHWPRPVPPCPPLTLQVFRARLCFPPPPFPLSPPPLTRTHTLSRISWFGYCLLSMNCTSFNLFTFQLLSCWWWHKFWGGGSSGGFKHLRAWPTTLCIFTCGHHRTDVASVKVTYSYKIGQEQLSW